MMKYLFGFLLSATLLFSQTSKEFPAIILTDVPGGKIEREEIYDGNSLWGLIDGGADVYLEYGFDKLLFQDIKWKGESFRVEFYKMIEEETAFGIFSISTHKCTLQDTLTKWICITPFQVQAAVGKFYISIANEKGNKTTEKLSIELLQIILSKQKEKLFILPDSIARLTDAKNINKVKFIKGDLGLQNGFPEWQDLFANFKNYTIYILPLDNDKFYTYLSKVNFQSAEDASRFIISAGIKIESSRKYYTSQNNKVLREIKIISEKELYYSETNRENPVIDKL